MERLRKANPKRERDKGFADRIPPGQFLTEKFPVLTEGPTPKIDLGQWRLKISGLVENSFELTWEEFTALPRKTLMTDLHCVTRWSMLDSVWEGVPFTELMKRIRVKPEAKFVMEHSYGGYSTNMALKELLEDDVLLAYRYNGKPLERDHGGPMRMLVPKLYLWKSAKWLSGLEFIAENRPGFWERYGYHIHGDPWTEERFVERRDPGAL